MATNDGGTAFPATRMEKHPLDGMLGAEPSFYPHEYPGMSLRDWFAGQALTALNVLAMELYRSGKTGVESCAILAVAAYELADQLLKAREL